MSFNNKKLDINNLKTQESCKNKNIVMAKIWIDFFKWSLSTEAE